MGHGRKVVRSRLHDLDRGCELLVVAEATTNLASGIWTSLTNTTLGTSGALYFADPSSPSPPSRFYRIVFP